MLNVYDGQVFYLFIQLVFLEFDLSLFIFVYVYEGGFIEFFEEVFIEKYYILEFCGGLLEKIQNLTVRNYGVLIIGFLVGSFVFIIVNDFNILKLIILIIDYDGRLVSSFKCQSFSIKIIFDLIVFNVLEEFILDIIYFVLILGKNVINYFYLLLNVICFEFDMYVYRNINCILELGYYEFGFIIIELGGVFYIEGDF